MIAQRLNALVVYLSFVVLTLLAPVAAEGTQIRKAAEPVKDRYVVRLAAVTTGVDATAKDLAAKYDGRLLAVWKHAIKGFSIQMTAERASQLARDARVASIEEDAILHPAGAGEQPTGANRPPDGVTNVIPQDPDPLWHLTRISHRGLTPATGETTLDYYKYRYTNDGSYVESGTTKRVKVYLIDMGVWVSHREFSGAVVSEGVNIGRTPFHGPYPEPAMSDTGVATNPCGGGSQLAGTTAYHGTAVASAVVGKYVGVAKGVELVPIQVASCTDDQFVTTTGMLIGGFEWVAEHGEFPSVVSISTYLFAGKHGDSFPCGPGLSSCAAGKELTALEDAVNAVVDLGFPVVVAANNQDSDACYTTPARLSRRRGRLDASERRTGVITVGGTDRADRRWDTSTGPGNPGSNYGQCVDIFAPAAQMAVAFPSSAASYMTESVDRTRPLVSGTSYSAPIVAGIIARMMAANAELRVKNADTQTNIWKALEANASPFSPSNVGVASPRLLAYLGAVTFKSQPPAKIVGQSGDPVSLAVSVAEPVSYQWYKGTTLIDGATEAVLNVTISAEHGGTGRDYWVRATSTVHGAAYYADSNKANIRIGSCARPEITQQPTTLWVGGPFTAPATFPATLTANVTAEAGVTYAWKWVRADVGDSVITSGTATGSSTRSLTVSTAAAEVATYQLVITPIGTCNGWDEVRSDTAQIRTCAPPPAPSILTNDGQLEFGERLFANASSVQDGAKLVWYYAASAGGPFEPLLESIPENDVATAGGNTWVIYQGLSIIPPKPGHYKLVAENGCGSSALSAAVEVTRTCTFQFQGKAEGRTFAGQSGINAGQDYNVPQDSRGLLEVRAHNGTFTPADVDITWQGEGSVSRDGKSFKTRPLVDGEVMTVTATANQPGSACPPQSLTFTIHGTPRTCTPIVVKAGHCTLYEEPILVHSQNVTVPLRTLVEAADGTTLSAADLSNLTFDWETNGAKNRLDVATDERSADYVVGAYNERIDVTVKNGACVDRTWIYVRPLEAICTTNCDAGCRRRGMQGVRVNGVQSSVYTVLAGQPVTLSAPEIVAGATYQWFARELGTLDAQMFATTPSVNISPAVSAEYWVVTDFGDEVGESQHLELVVNQPEEASPVTVTPTSRVVPADTTTTFTADYPGATLATRYEWRHGPDKKLWRVVIGDDPTLTVHADNDDTFWCRVVEPATPTTPEVSHESNMVYLTVTCTNAVTGHIGTVPRLQRGERPRINAFGKGKDLVYTWTRTLPNDPTPVVVEEWLPYIIPEITEPITEFSVSAVDACGQTGDLGRVSVYLCVPTITTQPTGRLVAPGTPVTLSVAATKAFDGQTLSVAWYRSSDSNRTNPLSTNWDYTPTVAPGTSETFYAAITTDCGGSPNVVTSQAATVEVCAPPAITTVGQSFWISPGHQTYLSVNATGKDLTYQWYTGTSGNTSSPITNGGNESSIIRSPSTTTSYWCRVTSQGLCSTNGPTWTLKVCTPPTITTQPVGIRLFPNKTTLLSVTASAGSNTEPLQYKWQQQNASGQWIDIGEPGPSSTYTTPPFTVDTTYRVIVSAGNCETPSAAVVVSRCAYSEVVPGSESKIGYNESVSLLLPTMSPVENKTITWYRGDVGDTSNEMRTAVGTNLLNPTGPLTATTLYWAAFTHEGCQSRTSVYTVKVCKPAVTSQPVGSTIRNGQSAILTAGVTPIANQTFQWYAGPVGTTTNPVSVGTSTSTTASVTVSPTATTTYWLRVTGTCGFTADSAAVTVTVCNPPTISSVSPTRFIESGGQTTISVNANGSNLTYRWYVGLPGDTSVELSNGLTTGTDSSATVAPNVTKTYWCRVTSEGLCSVDSAAVTVDVCTDPTINTEPQSKVQFSGKPVTLSVAATGAGTLSYQWYQGASGITNAPVSGQTSTSFTFNASTNTSYWCRVTTRVCTDDSAAATVSLCTYPEIVNASPAQRNIYAGESVTMMLPTMNPLEVKDIRWYRGEEGVPTQLLKSGTGTNLSLTVAPEVTTKYWAEFTHNTCVSRTTAYTVTVCKPTITQQPPSAMIVQNGATPTLTVTTTGEGVSYQWYIGNPGDVSQPAPGPTAITRSYTTPPLAANTTYWVRVGGCGVTADSTASVITVCSTPTVSLSRTANFTIGTTGTITATTTGANLTYQWYRGQTGDVSQPISGQTTSQYSFTLVKSEYYWVRVTTGCSGASVNSAHILYDVAPKITVQPQSMTVPFGSSVRLSITATGNFLTYQWYQGGSTLLPGETGPTFKSPVLNTNTNYWCKVSSGGAWANSTTAAITMCSGPNISSFTISFKSGTTYELWAKVGSSDILDVEYDWYQGVPGDPTLSTYLGPGNPKMSFWNVTASKTIWVRVKFEDGSCYKDTGGITIPAP